MFTNRNIRKWSLIWNKMYLISFDWSEGTSVIGILKPWYSVRFRLQVCVLDISIYQPIIVSVLSNTDHKVFDVDKEVFLDKRTIDCHYGNISLLMILQSELQGLQRLHVSREMFEDKMCGSNTTYPRFKLYTPFFTLVIRASKLTLRPKKTRP